MYQKTQVIQHWGSKVCMVGRRDREWNEGEAGGGLSETVRDLSSVREKARRPTQNSVLFLTCYFAPAVRLEAGGCGPGCITLNW